MHCKIVFNFALRHDLAFLQDNRLLAKASFKSQWPMDEFLIDWMITVCEIYIMVADSQISKQIKRI